MEGFKSKSVPAKLLLEDGSVYTGFSIGVPGTAFGEIVFNTSATGYQEILTDPSYQGQMVMMTYPEIGNYGINLEDHESDQVHVAGFVIKRLSPITSSWRAQASLQDFLAQQGVVGIEGVDTRAITRRIRDMGTMKAAITTEEIDQSSLLIQLRNQRDTAEQDLVGKVTTPSPEIHTGTGQVVDRVVVVDFGIKRNILQSLGQFVKEMVLVPAHTSFEEIQGYHPQGVLLSNGPGDPRSLPNVINMCRHLVSSGIPTFGICLGHQLLALACGAQVQKMAFGHHGANHPVKDLETGAIAITSQNHGYSVEFQDFPEDRLKVTHLNLNDGTIEGFRHLHSPVNSVQFHPEASPGPHDAQYLFEFFIQQILNTSNQNETPHKQGVL